MPSKIFGKPVSGTEIRSSTENTKSDIQNGENGENKLEIDLGQTDEKVEASEPQKLTSVKIAFSQKRPSPTSKPGGIHKIHLPFQCTECGVQFTKKFALNRHLITSHSNKKKQLKCEECEEQFGTETELKTHITDAHTKVTSTNPNAKPYSCPHCIYKCAKSLQLAQHLTLLHSNICRLQFSRNYSLRRHQKTAHVPNTERPVIKCQECEKVYSCIGNLNQHIRMVHKKECMFKCQINGTNTCTKAFMSVRELRLHEKLEHAGESSKFGCVDRDDVKRMIWKPFQCQRCSAMFDTAAERGEHQTSEH